MNGCRDHDCGALYMRCRCCYEGGCDLDTVDRRPEAVEIGDEMLPLVAAMEIGGGVRGLALLGRLACDHEWEEAETGPKDRSGATDLYVVCVSGCGASRFVGPGSGVL